MRKKSERAGCVGPDSRLAADLTFRAIGWRLLGFLDWPLSGGRALDASAPPR